jgi:CubicO group peptidase (beta-lactamase class C family)
MRWTRQRGYAALCGAIGLLLLASPGRAEAGIADQVDPIVERLMAACGVPGAALCLVTRNRVVLAKGYGVRNEMGDPVTESTLFGIGSLTKSLTALEVAQLVDEGKIDLDAPVVSYIPELRLSNPAATRALTVREVLSQASGIPRSDAIWVFGAPADRKAIVDDIANVRLTARPGAAWQYSNQNYLIAGYLVERVSGETWEEYTRRSILGPLEMTDADFGIDAMQGTADWSETFRTDSRGRRTALPFNRKIFANLALMGPAGSLNASIFDMARYAMFQLGDGTFGGRRIVSSGMLGAMHEMQIGLAGLPEGASLAARSATSRMGYGFGWFTEEYKGHRLAMHPGIIGGFRASMTIAPDDGVGLVVLTNSRSGGLLASQLRLRLIEMMWGLAASQDPGAAPRLPS